MKLIAFGCKVGSTVAIFCVLSFVFIDFWLLYVVVLCLVSPWGGQSNREPDPVR